MTRPAAQQYFGAVRARAASDTCVVSCVQHSAARRLPAHTHQAAYFAFIVRGDYREETSHGTVDHRPLALTFRPSELRHRDEIGPRGTIILTIELLQWDLRLPDCEGDRVLSALRLYHHLVDEPHDPLVLESCIGELLATEEELNPAWLRRAVDLIHECYREPLTVAGIAREAGVHPVHFTRVYRRHIGEGVGDTIRRLRAQHAARLFAANDTLSLAAVAAESGFADQAHLTRIYRELTGLPPGRSRALMQGTFPRTA